MAIMALVAGACGGDDDDSGAATSGDDGARGGIFDEPAAEPADEGGDDGGEAFDAEAGLAQDLDDEAEFAPADEEPAEEPAAVVTEAEASEEAAADEGLFAGRQTVDADEPRVVEPPRDNRFADYGIRDFVDADDDPLSTFALDVDTGSYSVARNFLNNGTLPPPESVRVEEYVNVFDYGYDDPRTDALGISVDGGPSPFDEDNYLVRIGVQSQRLDDDERPEASLTFVIDTSGSMAQGGRLELVKDALEELVGELEDEDTIAIVEFDDNPSVVLEPTEVEDDDEIFDALDDLEPGGSTNVEAGLELGYDLAAETFDDDRVNRVILLSDGVANVGLTDPDGLAEMIRRDADRGIQLLTIGVGLGNFNDVLLEQLADQGDGFYAYVDTEDEAERLFEDNLTATLVTLAIDAKIQVEFDEDVVEEYRLIGFENRGVLDSDFRNDDVDAGEIGAGHQVTAIYEIELERGVDLDDRDEIGEVRLRWEEPGTGDIAEIEEDIDLDIIEPNWTRTSDSFQLAVVVATFAEVLRDSPFADDIDLDDLEDEADNIADRLDIGEIEEFADLVSLADRFS
ncbi:MAG: von Willebrand factor type A domain-containing protein [Actinomycetota bacterium]